MTLEYELGISDAEAFFRHQAAHAPHILRRVRLVRAFYAASFAFMTWAAYASSLRGAAVVLGAAGILLVACYGRLARWQYVRHNRSLEASADGLRPGTTKLTLADARLEVATSEGGSWFNTSAIRRIEEAPGHYFIYLGPIAALVVPKAGTRGAEPRDVIASLRAAAPAQP